MAVRAAGQVTAGRGGAGRGGAGRGGAGRGGAGRGGAGRGGAGRGGLRAQISSPRRVLIAIWQMHYAVQCIDFVYTIKTVISCRN